MKKESSETSLVELWKLFPFPDKLEKLNTKTKLLQGGSFNFQHGLTRIKPKKETKTK